MKIKKKVEVDETLDQKIKVVATYERTFYIDLLHVRDQINNKIPMFEDDEDVIQFFEEQEKELLAETGDGIQCYLFDDVTMSMTADDFEFDITLEKQ